MSTLKLTSSHLHHLLAFSLLAMRSKHVLFVILFQGIMNSEVFADEQDSASSRSAYFMMKKNKRLLGYVFKRFESSSLLSCSHSCMRDMWCTSTNFKVSSKNDDKGTCELNKHHISLINGENTSFHEEEGGTFSMLFTVNIFSTDICIVFAKGKMMYIQG